MTSTLHNSPAARRAALLALLTAGTISVACSDTNDVTVGSIDDAGAAADGGVVDVDGGVVDVDGGAPSPSFSGEVTCKVSPCVTALSASGGGHACALLSDKSVRCWGSNASGQLGAETPMPADAGAPDGGGSGAPSSATPVTVADLTDVTQISVSGRSSAGTSCARRSDGSVACWGANTSGQLGRGADRVVFDADAHTSASRVQGLPPATRVDVAGTFACATGELGPDGEGAGMHCWGDNSALQLGRGYLPRPIGVAGPVNLRYHRVVAGAGTGRVGFALRDDGDVLSWGGGDWHELNSAQRDALGRETSFSPDEEPREIPDLHHATRLVAGEGHACALAQGSVWCWGRNATGAVGNSSRIDVFSPSPVSLMGAEAIREMAASNLTTCAVDQRGRAYCWGDNTRGQLGSGDAELTLIPVLVAGLELETKGATDARVVQIATMDQTTCALLEDGSVQCWGDNSAGQLGVGTKDDASHYRPERVVF
ncbi:MAG: hypothetical protein KF850_09250 [Labilithrix sp.]|nr:hypothetical protein [Labilithrix sp.]